MLSDGGSEMQVHLSVETSLEALLIVFLVVVEITIEVWHLLICKVAGSHAVLEYHSLSCVEVHILLMNVLALKADS